MLRGRKAGCFWGGKWTFEGGEIGLCGWKWAALREENGLFCGREWGALQESAGIFGENLWFILGVSFYIGLGNRGI